MPNGLVLILGGSIGSNTNNNLPNYEVFPPVGDCQVNPNLAKCTINIPSFTDGFNRINEMTYPHAFVLPTGKLFVLASWVTVLLNLNEADRYNFVSYTRLPDIVVSNGARVPRTYPPSGAGAMLPITFKDNYRPEILICGGVEAQNGIQSVTTRTCGRIAPEDADAKWDYSDPMPYGRSMADLVNLPDGTLLLMNGAKKGMSGFATAVNPAFEALIYDPRLPRGARWKTAGTSKIPRLCKYTT